MGIKDSLKKVFGGKSEPEADVTVSPSQMLRDVGVDPGGLNYGFGSDGSITVSGQIADDSDRQKILDTLSGAAGINRVEDQMTVSPPEPIEETSQEPVAIEPEEPEAVSAGDRTYTVQSGDTLWKIAEEMYGNGSNYMKIFEANSELLENPDHILPGQELLIPDLNN